MDTAQLLLDVLGPVVLIVAAGAAIGPRIGLDGPTLSKLAYWILGPAFVFNIFATTTLEAETAIKLVIAGTCSVVAGAVGARFLAMATGVKGSLASSTVMSGAYGNVGNAGLAISAFALGDEILDRAGVLMVTIMFLGTLLSVWLGTMQSQSAVQAARQALLSPMVVAGIVGFFLNLTSLDLPTVVDRAVTTTSQGLIPVMLLALGLQLATGARLRWFRTTSVVGAAKLLIAPAIGGLVASLLGLSGDDLGVVVLQSAMPPAVFCMVLALEHDMESERTTNDVVATTLAALLTLPVALSLVA